MVGSWVTTLLLGAAVSSVGAEFHPGKSYRALRGRAPSPDVVTDNIVPLAPVNSARRHYKGLRRRQSAGTGNVTAISNPSQANYVAQVGWGNDGTYSMILDTGSSDTWILGEGFQCLDTTGAPTDVRVLRPVFLCQLVSNMSHSKATAMLGPYSPEISLVVRLET